ncbi:tRNA-specific adenosine deaminase [bacterium J17]|nr:tRNA-specific adenosine deaminase [bacterium J17]
MEKSKAEVWMRAALAEAKKASLADEVPVGAVVVLDDEIISSAHNEVEALNDATAHAEILAIRRAGEKLAAWRLSEASLFVTLEPCTMCIGACVLSRIKNLYFGAYDERQGAVGSIYDLSNHEQLPKSINVYPEVLAEESARLLREFFGGIRGKR